MSLILQQELWKLRFIQLVQQKMKDPNSKPLFTNIDIQKLIQLDDIEEIIDVLETENYNIQVAKLYLAIQRDYLDQEHIDTINSVIMNESKNVFGILKTINGSYIKESQQKANKKQYIKVKKNK